MKLKLDQRYKTTKTINRWFNKYTAAAGMWGFLIGALLSMYFSLEAKTPLLDPRGTSVVPQVVEVKAEEKKPLSWNDAIRQVFPADEAGKMIRICMTENKAQNKYAMNVNTNKTYDYSWCQVNSCHKPKDMTHSEWMKNLEDPMFNAQQVRKIFLSQGWNAWVVYNKGLVK